jgi:ElaB/YqjD/DUF883 family membrane-anchored ribosome-binding protein
MKSTDQLEMETEESRARLGETIDQLKAMTPGRVLDEVLDYAKDGGGEFLRRMGQQVADNPAPAIMIGAGLVWMMSGTGKLSKANVSAPGVSNGVSGVGSNGGLSALGSATQSAKETAHALGEGVSNTLSSLTDKGADAYHTVADKADAAATSVRDTAASLGDSAVAMEQRLVQATRGLVAFCKDQPLVLAGLGLALGATLGAAVPETETEDRAMGEMSDRLKGQMKTLASDQFDSAKNIAGHVLDESAKVLKQDLNGTGKVEPDEKGLSEQVSGSDFYPTEDPKTPAWNAGDGFHSVSR